MISTYLLAGASEDTRPLFSNLPVVTFTTIDSTTYSGITAASLPNDVIPLALSNNMAAHWYMETSNTTRLSIRDTAAGASYLPYVILNHVVELATFDDANNLMFTYSSDLSVRIYDTSQLASNTLPLISTITNIFADNLFYHNGYLYADRKVYDVSTPSAPVLLGNSTKAIFGIHSSGQYAIGYSSGSNRFEIYDIQTNPLGVFVSFIDGAVGASWLWIKKGILKSTNDRVAIYDTDGGHHISCINWSNPFFPTTQFPRDRFYTYFSDITLAENQNYSNFITQSGDLGYLARLDTLVFDLTASVFTILYRGNVSQGPGSNWWVDASSNRVMVHPALDNATYFGNSSTTNTNP